jgi:Carbohydrate binding domain
MYDDALASLRAGRFPRLKLYEPFDTIGVADTRISYTHTGVFDPVEQQHYNAFANDPRFSNGLTQPPPATTDHLSGCDKGVETGLSCFGGTYNAAVLPTWQSADGHGGTHSVQVTNTTGAAATLGLNTKPAPVNSSQTGRAYTGAAWVKASQVGVPLTLMIRERRADGSSPANGYIAVNWTATGTGWHQLTATYQAKETGNGITFSVYAPGMSAASWLRADDFSFTSTAL